MCHRDVHTMWLLTPDSTGVSQWIQGKIQAVFNWENLIWLSKLSCKTSLGITKDFCGSWVINIELNILLWCQQRCTFKMCLVYHICRMHSPDQWMLFSPVCSETGLSVSIGNNFTTSSTQLQSHYWIFSAKNKVN